MVNNNKINLITLQSRPFPYHNALISPPIQEVVLISQFAPIEVFRRGRHEERAWSYTLYGPGEIVLLESVDVFIPIEEIYRKIDFDEPLSGQ